MAPSPLNSAVQPTVCVGCLNSRACWVCLGQGVLPSPDVTHEIECHRCQGTGICFVCSPEEILDTVHVQIVTRASTI